MLTAYARVAAGLEKTARIWSRPSTGRSVDSGEPSWSERFTGSPFFKKAQEIERGNTHDRIGSAERDVAWSKRCLENAEFQVKIASIEKKLADWSFSQEGVDKLAFVEKLAECRHRSYSDWSDFFKGSPFFKTAMVLEVEDAQREADRSRAELSEQRDGKHHGEQRVARAELESELAVWRLEQMGFSKTAAVKTARIYGATIPEDYITSAEIPKEIRRQKFDKYVSTKSREKPTGTGKAVAVGGVSMASLGALLGVTGTGFKSRSAGLSGALIGGLVGAAAGAGLSAEDKRSLNRAKKYFSRPGERDWDMAREVVRVKRRRRGEQNIQTVGAYQSFAKTSSTRAPMSLPENTVNAFFAEIDEIEKSASAATEAARMVSRNSALVAGTGAAAVSAAAAGAGGHNKGKKTGRKQGLRYGYQVGARKGYRMGAQRGFRAGQVSVVRRLQSMQGKKKTSKK